nr:MAG TPA: hypothetical protein [Caudoviricetes sp.]
MNMRLWTVALVSNCNSGLKYMALIDEHCLSHNCPTKNLTTRRPCNAYKS